MDNEKNYQVTTICESPQKPLVVKIKRLSEGAVIPTKATPQSAGYDLVCPKDTSIHCGRQVVPLDLSIELPHGYMAVVRPRSGYSSKGFMVTLASSEYRIDADVIPGVIDADYRGPIGAIVKSNAPLIYTIKAGQRIAQLIIKKVEDVHFEETTELSDSERGLGGFGHSGI